MAEVKFKFDEDDKIRTSLGNDGIIQMLAVEGGDNKYYVQTAEGAGWYKEKELSIVE